MQAFLRRSQYTGAKKPVELLARLRRAPESRVGEAELAARRALVLALVATLKALMREIKALARQIASALRAHPDGQVFSSLFRGPKSVICAATLLAEIGDCRARYPTGDALAGDAGQAAVAIESGKRKAACFRWNCNKRLRQAFVTLADSTRQWHPWAQAVYARAIAKGHDHPRAIRTLGRAWSRIVWRCWQDRLPYELARHRAAQQYITVTIPNPSGDRIDVPATQRMAGDALDPSLDAGSDQGSLRAAQPSPPKQRSGGEQSKAARQGRAKRAA